MKRSRLLWQILAGVLVTCLIVLVSINYWAKARIHEEIKKLSEQKYNGLYSLAIGDAYVNIWNGELQASDIVVSTDTIAWNAIRACCPDSFPPVITLSVQTLHIRHFNWMSYLSKQVAHVGSVDVEEPTLQLIQRQDTAVHDTSSWCTQLLKLPQLISPMAKVLTIKSVSINRANAVLQTLEKADTLTQHIGDAALYVKNVNINDTSGEITYCKVIELKIQHYDALVKSGTLLVSLDTFMLSKSGRKLRFSKLSLAPQISEQTFFRSLPSRKAYFALTCAAVIMEGFDLNRFIKDGYLFAESMQLESPFAQLTISKYLPLPYRRKLPAELVRESKTIFNLKEVLVKNGYISLTTRLDGPDYDIVFARTYVTANNFSNDSTCMDNNHPLEMRVESHFMDDALIMLNLNVPLLSPTFDADYTATVEGFSMEVLNPAIINNNVSIKDGYMQSMNIRSVIRGGVATGKLIMQYHDLELEVLHKDSGKTRKVVSKIANMFVNGDNVRDNDPSTEFITGDIYYVRNRQEEFFGYLWHSILQGMLPVLVPSYDKIKK